MNAQSKRLLKAAVKNGAFWSAILMVLTYFKNGVVNWYYLPLWFLFFAGTGAARVYYLQNRTKK